MESDEDIEKNVISENVLSVNGNNMADVDFLSAVDGLNYKAAIGRMAGNIENYIKVLNVSASNIRENYNVLCTLSDLSNMAKAAHYFHGLKGIFLNIGADFLAEQSKQLELAAKAFDTAYVKGYMGEYLKQVSEFAERLSKTCSLYGKHGETFDGRQMDEDEFIHNLKKIRSLIEDYEYTEIMELLEKTMPNCGGEKRQCVNKIYELLQNFEYEEALTVISHYCNNIL